MLHRLHLNPITISLHEMSVQVTVLLLAVEVWSPSQPTHMPNVTIFTSPSSINFVDHVE